MAVAAVGVIGLALCAASHGEEGVELDRAAVPTVGLRNGADHGARIQHVIVERKVIGRDMIDAQVALAGPGLGAQIGRYVEQRLFVALAGPISLQRGLQFALGAYPGEAEGGDGDGHDALPVLLMARRADASGRKPARVRRSGMLAT